MTEIGINYLLYVLFVCFVMYSAMFWTAYWLTGGTFKFTKPKPLDTSICLSCKGKSVNLTCPSCNGTGRVNGYFDSR